MVPVTFLALRRVDSRFGANYTKVLHTHTYWSNLRSKEVCCRTEQSMLPDAVLKYGRQRALSTCCI